MKPGEIKVTKDNVAAILAEIKNIARKEVLVGIPAEKSPRKGDAMTNAYLGFIHDHGSPANNIPARPFLSRGVEAAKEKCAAVLGGGVTAALTGNKQQLNTALEKCGLIAQASVKNAIVQGDFAPLKPATLAARKRGGFKGEKALIRTGQLLGSITYVVRGSNGPN